MSTVASVPPPGIPPLPVMRFSVEQYHALVRSGVIAEDAPVELLNGYLVPKMTKNLAHIIALRKLNRRVSRMIPAGWQIILQDPVTTDDSEPEPDLAIVRGEIEDYEDRNPGPLDVALIVEVADTSLARDRGFKKALYAEAGFAAYWILNVADRRLETFADPTGPIANPDFRTNQVFAANDEVPVVIADSVVGTLKVSEILP